MPYGSETKKGDSSLVKYQQLTPSGPGYTYTTTRDGFENNRLYWLRSGGFAPSRSLGSSPRPPLTYVKKLVTLRNGPKLSYSIRVYSYKRKKWVWVRARAPLVVERLVPVYPSKQKKKRKLGLDLPPNNLHFKQYKLSGGGSSVNKLTAPHKYVNGFAREIEADLMYPGNWPGGQFPFPPYLFTTQSIESQFGSRWTEAVSETNTKALNKLYERVKNMPVNLGQVLAEARQTATLIADTAVKIAKVIALAKKGNLPKAFKELFPLSSGQAANSYLAYVYGVKPLLQDIDGAMKNFAEGRRNDVFDIVVKRSKDIPLETQVAGTGIPKGLTTLSMSGSVTTVYKVRIQITNRDQNDLVTNGTLNIPAIGWELVPFSFVIDWFAPIGNFLSNLDAFVGLTVLSCHRTTVLKRDVTIRRDFGGVDGDDYEWPKLNRVSTFSQVEVTRTVLPTVPDLPFVEFKNPVGKDHILNAIALITSLLSRK